MTIKAKQQKSKFIILAIGSVSTLVISAVLIFNALSSLDVSYLGLLFGLFIGLFSVASWYCLLEGKEISLEDDVLIIQSRFKKNKQRIKLKDIESYMEIEKANKYSKWKDLTIFTADSRYVLSSYSIINYAVFKSRLTKGKKANRSAEALWRYKSNVKYGIGFTLVGIVFSIFFWTPYSNRNNEILKEDLLIVEGELLAAPIFKRKRKGGNHLNLMLKELPNMSFSVGSLGLKGGSIDKLIKEVEIGDSLKLGILAPNSLANLKNLNTANVYSIASKEKSYLSLLSYNIERKKSRNSMSMLLLLGFSAWLLIYGIYLWITNSRLIMSHDTIK